MSIIQHLLEIVRREATPLKNQRAWEEDRHRADRRKDRSNVGCSMQRSNRLCAEGLKEGIGFVPIEEEEKDEEALRTC